LQTNRDAGERKTVNKVGGAVNRINVPGRLIGDIIAENVISSSKKNEAMYARQLSSVRKGSPSAVMRFLSDKFVSWISRANLLENQLFAFLVGLLESNIRGSTHKEKPMMSNFRANLSHDINRVGLFSQILGTGDSFANGLASSASTATSKFKVKGVLRVRHENVRAQPRKIDGKN
jgi:hypothetical protein